MVTFNIIRCCLKECRVENLAILCSLNRCLFCLPTAPGTVLVSGRKWWIRQVSPYSHKGYHTSRYRLRRETTKELRVRWWLTKINGVDWIYTQVNWETWQKPGKGYFRWGCWGGAAIWQDYDGREDSPVDTEWRALQVDRCPETGLGLSCAGTWAGHGLAQWWHELHHYM